MSQVTYTLQQLSKPQNPSRYLLCGMDTNFKASSEVSLHGPELPRDSDKVEGTLFHLPQLHRLPLFGRTLLGATMPRHSL